MITHKQYMSDSSTLHNPYHGEIANACRIRFDGQFLARVKIAIETDRHINNIPLKEWDRRGAFYRGSISRELKARGDTCSLASIVCVMKAAARLAIL